MLDDITWRTPAAISLGAIAGALSRYYLTLFLAHSVGMLFPIGTFFINCSGCLLMGFVVTLASDRIPSFSPDLKLMLTTGFLGAYTTFSTYGLEALTLLRNQQYQLATLYTLGSVILGVVGVQIGSWFASLGK